MSHQTIIPNSPIANADLMSTPDISILDPPDCIHPLHSDEQTLDFSMPENSQVASSNQIPTDQVPTPTVPVGPIRRTTSPSPNLNPPLMPSSPKSQPCQQKSFRLNCQTLFATAPRCSMSKESAMTNLLNGPFPVEYAKIAQENHKDEGLHLHLLVRFKKKINIRDPRSLDYITQSHINLQAAKSVERVSAYLSKEDPSPLVFGNPPAGIVSDKTTTQKNKRKKNAPTERITDQIANKIKDGCTLPDLFKSHPGFVMMNLTKISTFQAKLQATLNPLSLIPTHRLTWNESSLDISEAHLQIFNWLKENLFNYKRAIKTRQLYIWGPPNLNKTSLVAHLGKTIAIYYMPGFEMFDDLWQDYTYDLCVLDEFVAKSVRVPQFLNQFADGQSTTLRVKGSQYSKKHNIPFIVLSNFCPEDTVPSHQLPMFRARFDVVHLETSIPFDELKFEEIVPISSNSDKDEVVISSQE